MLLLLNITLYVTCLHDYVSLLKSYAFYFFFFSLVHEDFAIYIYFLFPAFFIPFSAFFLFMQNIVLIMSQFITSLLPRLFHLVLYFLILALTREPRGMTSSCGCCSDSPVQPVHILPGRVSMSAVPSFAYLGLNSSDDVIREGSPFTDVSVNNPCLLVWRAYAS